MEEAMDYDGYGFFSDENYYPAWVGMKRGYERSEGKLDAALEKRRKCDGNNSWVAVAPYAPGAGSKRGYQGPKGEEDPLCSHKRYKCNYWEDPDPASQRMLRRRGGTKAMDAAFLNYLDRVTEKKEY